MIRRLLILLLALQAGAALALAVALHRAWHPAWAAALGPAPGSALMGAIDVALGVAAVVFVRMLISANNFLLSWRAGSATPPAHRLGPRRAAALFLGEFRASMLASSYDMLKPVGLRLRSAPAFDADPGARRPPVLLIHGYACNSGYWAPLSAVLGRAGIAHHGIDLEPPGCAIDDYVPQVQAAVERLLALTGAGRVVIVAHSMGGLVARAWLRRHGGARLARLITLGTPHHGTGLASLGPGANARQMRRGHRWLAELAGAEDAARRAAITSIFSHHDNIVAPQESCRLPGARNVELGGVGHVALGRSAAVLASILQEINAAGL
ncbi:alpha/beta fold hydrolase [Rugamonas sp.]|uniref:esterase/lipase family protein n=1 Tax=Rugamonas sp. TaxID=1926287 RepID=UPI0025CC4C64|nr:alpha/beta fold hydrolase [Rugamonas sp.]